ncbi:MAG: choice-of-anchor Q domain-containing protein [Pirellulales bacterium]
MVGTVAHRFRRRAEHPQTAKSASGARRSRGRRLSFEVFEDRRLLTVFTVTNLNDLPVSAPNQAPGTLRQAIFDANQAADADSIMFAAGLSGTVDLSIVGNTAEGPSALAISSPITIQGNAAGITIGRVDPVPMRLFHVTSSGDLTLRSITLSDGLAQGAAGELGRGGGIFVSEAGRLQVIASTLVNHEARGGGSGVGGRGGAIYNDGGVIRITNATLSGNAVRDSVGSTMGSWGGGIYSRNGSLSIYDSTIANNVGLAGIGVYVIGDGSGRTADIKVRNSIVAQGGGTDVVVTNDNGGAFTTSGAFNIVRDAPPVTLAQIGAILVTDPLVGPLADNGGPTWTHAILSDIPDNPAIDQGDPNFNANDPDGDPQTLDAILYDQRGAPYVRVANGDGASGSRVDVGAFEFHPASAPPELPGDYNADHKVNAADYTIWRNTLGMNVPRYFGADGDGSEWVDTGDYQLWKANFGSVPDPEGSAEAVPLSAVDQSPGVAAEVVLAAATVVSAQPNQPASAPPAVDPGISPPIADMRRLLSRPDQPKRPVRPGRPTEDWLPLLAAAVRDHWVITRSVVGAEWPTLAAGGGGCRSDASPPRERAEDALPAVAWDQLWSEWPAAAIRLARR